jgi:hypothetical protein
MFFDPAIVATLKLVLEPKEPTVQDDKPIRACVPVSNKEQVKVERSRKRHLSGLTFKKQL